MMIAKAEVSWDVLTSLTNLFLFKQTTTTTTTATTNKESIMTEQYRKVKSISNVRVFSYKYLGPTNHRGSRIKITDKWFGKSKTISFNYEFRTDYEGAIAYLMEQGFDVASMNSEEQIIIINGWTGQQLK
jgi:hypothetical protein